VLRIVTALERESEDRVVQSLAAEGHELVARVDTAHDLVEAVRVHPVDGVVVSATRRQLTAEVIANCDELGVRLVAVAASDPDRRYAAGLGLHEIVAAEAPWHEVELLLRGATVLGDGQPPRSSKGTVIAVWGPAGAPGRTMLTIQLAAELASRGRSVAIADADTYGGSVAPTLGMLDESPSFAAACRLAGHDSLTVSELERVGSRYSSPKGSFWVLTGIGRPSRWPELGSDRVAKTIAVCRDWVDYLVVDTGFSLEADEEISSDLFAPRRNAATTAALRQADHVIAVGSGDPIGLSRFLRAHVDLLEAVETDAVTIVINRVRQSAVGLNPAHQIRQTLMRFGGLADPVLVPLDTVGVDSAVLAGKSVIDAAPRSAVRASVARLVETRILPPEEKPLSRRELRRLAGEKGNRRRVSSLG
jgi:MinD-like ATPase involved in chromosome partitioning or flagellar assembly